MRFVFVYIHFFTGAANLRRVESDLQGLNDGQLTIWELHGYQQLTELCRSFLGPRGVAPEPPPPKLETSKPRGRSGRGKGDEGDEVVDAASAAALKKAEKKAKGRIKSRIMDLIKSLDVPLIALAKDVDGVFIPNKMGNVLELLRHVERNLW